MDAFQNTLPLPSSFSSAYLGPFVLGGVLLLLLSSLRRRKRDTERPWPVVPGALPLIGNPIGPVENLVAQLEEWCRLYGKSGLFEFSLFGVRYIVACNDETALRIESQRPYKVARTRMVNAAVKSIGADGVFTAEGNVWKKDRRLVGPSLNRKNVRDYLASVKQVSGRLVAKLDSICDDTVNIGNHILASTVDIISLVAFDKDVDCVSNGRSEMGEDLKRAFLGSQTRILSPFSFWKIPIIGQYLDGAGWAIKRLENEFSRLAREGDNSPDISEAKTFLAKIISYNKGGSGDNAMSHKRLTGNLMTMFAAGSETTHVTMCSALHTIAIDETGLQEELAAEALALGDLEAAGLDEITDGLPRLRSLIYETLRIQGPTPFLGVENTEPLELVPGTVLPPHTNFFVPWRYISTLDNADPSRLTPLGPNNTPRAAFDARRWLTETPAEGLVVNRPSHKTGFRPFGEGMRVCPGRELAELEMLVVLSSILRKFEIALEPNHAPMKLVTRFTESPNVDIRLIMEPRKLSLKEALRELKPTE